MLRKRKEIERRRSTFYLSVLKLGSNKLNAGLLLMGKEDTV
jgi:hypothetical protein